MSNVRGDKQELVKMLKAALGTGGHEAGHDRVEIQGDHAAAIQGLLLRHQTNTGMTTMKGVSGLKPVKPTKGEKAAEAAENVRKADRARSAELLEAQKARRLEARQRAVKEATLVKPESSRQFHAFAAMMKRWRYWDHDYARLHEMHARHVADLDAAERDGMGRGISSILDADYDQDQHESGARSVALEHVRAGLDAFNGNWSIHSVSDASGAIRVAKEAHDQRSALMALGMIASPSPFRQTREQRLAESKRRAAAAKDAATKGTANAVADVIGKRSQETAWDPVLAALQRYGDDSHGGRRTFEGGAGNAVATRSYGGGIEHVKSRTHCAGGGESGAWGRRKPADAWDRRKSPGVHSQTFQDETDALAEQILRAASASTAGDAGGERLQRSGGTPAGRRVGKIWGQSGGGRGRGTGRVGAHGKGDLSRPTLGYTGSRKGGSGRGYFGYENEEKADAFYAGDDGEDLQDVEGEEDDRVLPASNPSASDRYTRGWEATPEGGFSFGPIDGTEDMESSYPTLGGGDEEMEMEQEEADLREALRLSLLEAERLHGPSSSGNPSRGAVGLHVECSDLWGELTEEEALKLAMELSEQEDERAKLMKKEYEAAERYHNTYPDGMVAYEEEKEKLQAENVQDQDAVHCDPYGIVTEASTEAPLTAADALTRLADLCSSASGGSSPSMLAEMIAGLSDLTLSMESGEDAADLLAAQTGCARESAEEIAAAIRSQRGIGDREFRAEGKSEGKCGGSVPSLAESSAATSMMPDSMDEDAALEEALRLSMLEATQGNALVPSRGSVAPGFSAELGTLAARNIGEASSVSNQSVRTEGSGLGQTDLLHWVGAQLMVFTGEADNSFLAEYILAMDSSAAVEEFLAESFGNDAQARTFAAAFDAYKCDSSGSGRECVSGVESGPSSIHAQGQSNGSGGCGRRVRRNRGVAMDSSMLGFTIDASPRDFHDD